MDITRALVLVASQSQEWPMTDSAVRGLHCQSEQIVTRGQTAQGPQCSRCHTTLCAVRSFLLTSRNRGCVPAIKHHIIDLSLHTSGGCATARAAQQAP